MTAHAHNVKFVVDLELVELTRSSFPASDSVDYVLVRRRKKAKESRVRQTQRRKAKLAKFNKAVAHIYAGKNHADFLTMSNAEKAKQGSQIPAFDATLASPEAEVRNCIMISTKV